jgi:radical SAM superfamily enzyme YgiQ (UPF0313 family)
MITLINTNRMTPPIGPLSLDYLAGALKTANIEVEILDLCLAANPDEALRTYFAQKQPVLVGLTFRNIDDCFWPSAQWFVPDLANTVQTLRTLTDAAIVLGGVGFSILPERILSYTEADFGIHGDGEQATAMLYAELQGKNQWEKVPGLLWRENGDMVRNPPAWPPILNLTGQRDHLDNRTYFRLGGQCGVETKRGCHRQCIYCVDPLAKGHSHRLREPAEIADEVEVLLRQEIDVLHICDSEFNIPYSHALAVSEEFARRSLGDKVQWYTYMAVLPFDDRLAQAMRQAGCVGINFTGDAASEAMLRIYRQHHTKEHLATAVRLCRENGIAVMTDLLLGGPGETKETLSETIQFIQEIEPDCAGASLGIRIYPHTVLAEMVESQGDWERNPHIKRKYDGEVDLFQPTFYLSRDMGENPAQLVRELVAGDPRFFEPMEEAASKESKDHNYNDNSELVAAIANGARGAYWNILRQLRT